MIRVCLHFTIWLKLIVGFVVAAIVLFLISGNKTPGTMKRQVEILQVNVMNLSNNPSVLN